MILTRKLGSDIIITDNGVEHPDIVIQLTNIKADLIKGELYFVFEYYHTDTSQVNGYDTINRISYIKFHFNLTSSPSFETVINLFDFSNNIIGFNEATVRAWVLNQIDERTGVPFNVNWE